MKLKHIVIASSLLTLIACGEGGVNHGPTSNSGSTPKLVLNDTGVTYFMNSGYVPFFEQINRKDWLRDISHLSPDDQKLYAKSGSPQLHLLNMNDQAQFPKLPPETFISSFSEPDGFSGQDASIGNDASNRFDPDGDAGFNFVKLDKFSGAVKDVNDTDFGCVQDKVTGLIWEHKTNTDPVTDFHSARAKFSWFDPDFTTNGGDQGQANGGACPKSIVTGDTLQLTNYVNQEKLCGFSDWRLPTIEELRSIVNYQVKSGTLDRPAMTDLRFFPYLADTKHRWTSQTVAIDGSRHRAFGFHMDEGQAQSHDKACQPKDGKVTDFFNGAVLVRSDNDNKF